MTPQQEQYIRGNHRRMSITEMASNLKIEDKEDVIKFMDKANLAKTRPFVGTQHKIPRNPHKKGYWSENDKMF